MGFQLRLAALVAIGLSIQPGAKANDGEQSGATQSEARLLDWHNDYGTAVQSAQEEKKMLFIFFHVAGDDAARDRFESEVLTRPGIQRQLEDYERLRVALDERVSVGGKKITLVEHAAFAHLRKRQGVAILDFSDVDSPYWHHVTSSFPFPARNIITQRQLGVILDLPPGSLTQRTIIYAVRIHPESPRGAEGHFDSMLARGAEQHSLHQARLGVQGHHNWDSRFHTISARLPDGQLAQEVCAESWPGEELVEAATECVHSWRRSSGHWSAVRARHPRFGFDMKRGRNGIWYATGIFGTKRR